MEYNKYRKINDKKILHKKGKQWITLSIGIMAMLGGTFLAKQENVHADTNNNQNNQQTQAIKQSNSQKTNLVQQHNTQPQQQNNEQSTKNISAQASVLHKAIVNNAARSAMQNANKIHSKKMKSSNPMRLGALDDLPNITYVSPSGNTVGHDVSSYSDDLLLDISKGALRMPDLLTNNYNEDYELTPSDEQYAKDNLHSNNKNMTFHVQPIQVPSINVVRQRYDYLADHENSASDMYSIKPDITHGVVGQLSPSYIKDMLDWINFYRGIYGISPVKDATKYDTLAQYGADDMDASGIFKHGLSYKPPKGLHISSDAWNKGADATEDSNLNAGETTPANIVLDYMTDDDNDVSGHRSWILDQDINVVGIGQSGAYNDFYWSAPSDYGSDVDGGNNDMSHIITYPAFNTFPYEFMTSFSDVKWSIMIPMYAEFSSDSGKYTHILVHDNTDNKNVPVSNIDESDGYGDYDTISYQPDENDILPNHQYTITIYNPEIPTNGKLTYTTKLYYIDTSDEVPSSTPSDTEPIVEDGKPSKIKSSRSLKSTAPTYHKTAKHTTKPKVRKHDQKVSSTPEPQAQQTKRTEHQQSMPTHHHESLKEYQDSPKNQEIKKEQKQTAKNAIKPSDDSIEQSKQSQTEPTADITQTRTTNAVSNTSEPNYSKSTTTGSPISQSNSDDNSQGNQSELPQTGDTKFNEELSAILFSISVSIGAFGKTIDKRKRD